MFLPCLPPGARHSSARASFAVSTRADNLMALAITTLTSNRIMVDFHKCMAVYHMGQ